MQKKQVHMPQEDLYKDIHHSIIHNNPSDCRPVALATAQTPINRWMDKQTVLYPCIEQ